MANNYSRRQQPNKKPKGQNRRRPTEHIKTGFSALQKTVAITAGILGIITALITINNYRNGNSNKKDTTSKTTIIKEKEVDNSDASNNSNANNAQAGDSADSNTAGNSNNSANQNQTATTVADDSDSNAAN